MKTPYIRNLQMSSAALENYRINNPTRPPEQGEQLALPWRVIENYKGGIPLSVHTEDGRCIARIDWLPNGSGRASEGHQMFAAYIVKAANEYPKLQADLSARNLDLYNANRKVQELEALQAQGDSTYDPESVISRVTAQRDELLAALKWAKDYIPKSDMNCTSLAQSAIANAENSNG